MQIFPWFGDSKICTRHFFCQQKYISELLSTIRFFGSKPSLIHINPSAKLSKDSCTPLQDPRPYIMIVGKLMYLHITRLDIAACLYCDNIVAIRIANNAVFH